MWDHGSLIVVNQKIEFYAVKIWTDKKEVHFGTQNFTYGRRKIRHFYKYIWSCWTYKLEPGQVIPNLGKVVELTNDYCEMCILGNTQFSKRKWSLHTDKDLEKLDSMVKPALDHVHWHQHILRGQVLRTKRPITCNFGGQRKGKGWRLPKLQKLVFCVFVRYLFSRENE